MEFNLSVFPFTDQPFGIEYNNSARFTPWSCRTVAAVRPAPRGIRCLVQTAFLVLDLSGGAGVPSPVGNPGCEVSADALYPVEEVPLLLCFSKSVNQE